MPDTTRPDPLVAPVAAVLRRSGAPWATADSLTANTGGTVTVPERLIAEVLAACRELGLITAVAPRSPQVLTDEEALETARWLAEMGDHPRFHPDGLGYQALVGQEGNIVFAHAQALRRQGPSAAAELGVARDLLLRHARLRASAT
jgi:hypothetical protein